MGGQRMDGEGMEGGLRGDTNSTTDNNDSN